MTYMSFVDTILVVWIFVAVTGVAVMLISTRTDLTD